MHSLNGAFLSLQPNCKEIYDSRLIQNEHSWSIDAVQGVETVQQAKTIIVRFCGFVTSMMR
jgi:hypothetical protein